MPACSTACGLRFGGCEVVGRRPGYVRRPLTRLARHLYASLQMSGVGLECVVWNTVQWPTALASGGLGGSPEQKLAADIIYEEVLSGTAPVVAQQMNAEAWRKTA